MLGAALKVRRAVVSETGEQDRDVDDRLAEDDVLAFGVNELGGQVTDLDE